MEIPQIDNGKAPYEILNIKHMLLLPAETPFGNMALKHMKIIKRLDHANEKILQIYPDWKKARAASNPYHDPLKHLLWIEEVFYFLKVTTDEIISLCYLIWKHKKDESYPTYIKIPDIGTLLKKIREPEEETKDFVTIFDDFYPWMDSLNDVANAYKHSFVNTDHNVIGRDEPCFPALHLRYNNLENDIKFYNLSLANIIKKFNEFYGQSTLFLKENSPPHS